MVGVKYLKLREPMVVVPTSVADPHHFDADPDPTFYFDADPDPTLRFDADPDPGARKLTKINKYRCARFLDFLKGFCTYVL